MKTPVRKGV